MICLDAFLLRVSPFTCISFEFWFVHCLVWVCSESYHRSYFVSLYTLKVLQIIFTFKNHFNTLVILDRDGTAVEVASDLPVTLSNSSAACLQNMAWSDALSSITGSRMRTEYKKAKILNDFSTCLHVRKSIKYASCSITTAQLRLVLVKSVFLMKVGTWRALSGTKK